MNSARSFFRHPGLAQTGDVSGFEQGADLRHPPIAARSGVSGGLQAGDAQMSVITAESPSFGEFGEGLFILALKGVGGNEQGAKPRKSRIGAARLFEPQDGVAGARF